MSERTYLPGDIYRHHELRECPHKGCSVGDPHSPVQHVGAVCHQLIHEDCCPMFYVAPAPMPFGPDGEPGDVVKVWGRLYWRDSRGEWVQEDKGVTGGESFRDWGALTAEALRYGFAVQRYTKAEHYTGIEGDVLR